MGRLGRGMERGWARKVLAGWHVRGMTARAEEVEFWTSVREVYLVVVS
jgi:hypothetical protein